MKTITIASIIFALLIMFFGFRTKATKYNTDEGIQFFTGTFQQAIDKAKKENKFIFLDAYASWCGPCKMMKKKTFTNKEVADFYNKYFINIAIDMEKGEGPLLSNKFGIEAYPTLLYFSSKGELIGKTTGFKQPDEFLKMGEKVSKVK